MQQVVAMLACLSGIACGTTVLVSASRDLSIEGTSLEKSVGENLKKLAQDHYPTREQASKELASMGIEALPFLQKALSPGNEKWKKQQSDLEWTRRIQALVMRVFDTYYELDLLPDECRSANNSLTLPLHALPAVGRLAAMARVDEQQAALRLSQLDMLLDCAKELNSPSQYALLQFNFTLQRQILQREKGFKLLYVEPSNSVLRLSPGNRELFKGLAELDFIIRLDLQGLPVEDADLKHLEKCQQLQELYLRYANISDNGLSSLGKLKNLTKLCLADVTLKDKGLAQLKGCTKLEFLDLSQATIQQDETLAGLSELSNLKTLYFDTVYGDFTEQGFNDTIGKCVQLEDLDLSGGTASAATLNRLSGLKSLRRLTLIGMKGVVDGEALSKFRELTNLDLGATKISDKKLKFFEKLTKLESLDMGFNELITDESLSDLVRCKKLRVLHLYTTNIGDKGLAAIGTLKKLESLSIQQTKVTDTGMQHVGGLLQLKSLETSGNPQLTGKALKHLTNLENLEYLGLSYTNVDDAGLIHLHGLQNLNQIDLRQTLVSQEGAKALKEKLPKCRILAN